VQCTIVAVIKKMIPEESFSTVEMVANVQIKDRPGIPDNTVCIIDNVHDFDTLT